MPLSTSEKVDFYEKIIKERDKIARNIALGKIPVDVASNYLVNVQRLVPLTPQIIETTDEPEGIIPAGSYHVSFLILEVGGQILGKNLRYNLEYFDFPYVGVPWGEISYNGKFFILIGS